MIITISGTTKLPNQGDILPNGKTVAYSGILIVGNLSTKQAAMDELRAVRKTHPADKGWVEAGFRICLYDTKWILKHYHYKEEEQAYVQ